MNFKEIHIGNMIEKRVGETGIELSRICRFICCTKEQVFEMYKSKSLDTEILLRWSKLLKYDFFRLYSQHMILYAPPSSKNQGPGNKKIGQLPVFRKNIYTKEIMDFIMELITTGQKTKIEVMQEYTIPKTTLYKWISKQNKNLKQNG